MTAGEDGEAVAKQLAFGPPEPVVLGSIPNLDELGFFDHHREM